MNPRLHVGVSKWKIIEIIQLMIMIQNMIHAIAIEIIKTLKNSYLKLVGKVGIFVRLHGWKILLDGN